jgi:hypothetical protein
MALLAGDFRDLTRNQLSALTRNQLSGLRIYRKDLESLPTLTKPYSLLLQDILTKKKIHNQSRFGDVNPENNTCDTPMCTAGHFVFLAGKRAFDFVKKYGYAHAYYALHHKIYPDIPAQNSESIPQEYALAYIEEMAEMEAGESKR